jgi:phage gpG-like protein
MNDFQVSINSDTLDQTLENFQASLADNSPALAAVADDLREMIAEQFATEGAASGTPWAPLAPSTLRKRRGGSILNATGALLSSLTDAGTPGHVEDIGGQQLLFGSSVPYAIFHQTGTRRMPARPIVALSADGTERWLGIVGDAIREKTVLLGTYELGGRK